MDINLDFRNQASITLTANRNYTKDEIYKFIISAEVVDGVIPASLSPGKRLQNQSPSVSPYKISNGSNTNSGVSPSSFSGLRMVLTGASEDIYKFFINFYDSLYSNGGVLLDASGNAAAGFSYGGGQGMPAFLGDVAASSILWGDIRDLAYQSFLFAHPDFEVDPAIVLFAGVGFLGEFVEGPDTIVAILKAAIKRIPANSIWRNYLMQRWWDQVKIASYKVYYEGATFADAFAQFLPGGHEYKMISFISNSTSSGVYIEGGQVLAKIVDEPSDLAGFNVVDNLLNKHGSNDTFNLLTKFNTNTKEFSKQVFEVVKNNGNIEKTLRITTSRPDGRVFWLEPGVIRTPTEGNGWDHIIDKHRFDFTNPNGPYPGYTDQQIQDRLMELMETVESSKIYNALQVSLSSGKAPSITIEDSLVMREVRIAFGSNGFILSFHPKN